MATRSTLILIIVVMAVINIFSVQSVDNNLFEAVTSDVPDQIAHAINGGSDINTIGPGGQTPLMFAVLGGKYQSAKWLLENGADTSIPEKDGYTPFHGAGFQGRYKIAQLLIDHGLDPRDKHKDGFEPIHRACWGAEERHMETVKVLIRNGVPYDAPASNGKKPLDMARSGTPVHKYLTKIHQEHLHDEM